ncbi:effector-associated constant component EACC1 [Streptomyces platensis]
MDIRFELIGPDSRQELRSLYTWLCDDRSLRGRIPIEPVRGPARPDEMGGDLEAVLALVSTLATLAQLPFSYAAWRDGRRPRSQVIVQVAGAEPGELEAVREAFPDVSVRPIAGDGQEPEPEPEPGPGTEREAGR